MDAEKILRILVECWCDQHGLIAEKIIITKKEVEEKETA